MILNRANKERIIENYLKDYNSYKVGIINCQKQLEYISPTLVSNYRADGTNSLFYIPNNTATVAIERNESKMAIELKSEIERFSLIIESIDRALESLDLKQKTFVLLRYIENRPMQEVTVSLGFTEEKSAYRIRRKVLDKLLISLNNLIALK